MEKNGLFIQNENAPILIAEDLSSSLESIESVKISYGVFGASRSQYVGKSFLQGKGRK